MKCNNSIEKDNEAIYFLSIHFDLDLKLGTFMITYKSRLWIEESL